MDAGAVRRSRRSWSREEKRRIVDETFRAGASVADVARRNGRNATWCSTGARRGVAQPCRLTGRATARHPPIESDCPPMEHEYLKDRDEEGALLFVTHAGFTVARTGITQIRGTCRRR